MVVGRAGEGEEIETSSVLLYTIDVFSYISCLDPILVCL